MRLIEEGTSAWLNGVTLLAVGVATIIAGDASLKLLGVVSIFFGLLFIYLGRRINKDSVDIEREKSRPTIRMADNIGSPERTLLRCRADSGWRFNGNRRYIQIQDDA